MRPVWDAAKAPTGLPGGRIASIIIGWDSVLRSLSGALDAALAVRLYSRRATAIQDGVLWSG